MTKMKTHCQIARLRLTLVASILTLGIPPSIANERKTTTIEDITIDYPQSHSAFVQKISSHLVSFSHALSESRKSLRNRAFDLLESSTDTDLPYLSDAVGLSEYSPEIEADHRKRLAEARLFISKMADQMLGNSAYTVWETSVLVRQLESGYKVPWCSYDPDTKAIKFELDRRFAGQVTTSGIHLNSNDTQANNDVFAIPITTKFLDGQTEEEAWNLQKEFLQGFGKLLLGIEDAAIVKLYHDLLTRAAEDMLLEMGLNTSNACWLSEGIASFNATYLLSQRVGLKKAQGIIAERLKSVTIADKERESKFLEVLKDFDFSKTITEDQSFSRELKQARRIFAFHAIPKLADRTNDLHAIKHTFAGAGLARKKTVSYTEVKGAFSDLYNLALESFFNEAKKEYIDRMQTQSRNNPN